jgi:hypothetical protein
MAKRGTAIDKKRAETMIDISLMNLIDEVINCGENPLKVSFYKSGNEIRITCKDMFLYYRYKNKDFDVIVKGGKTYGKKFQRQNQQQPKEE